MTPYDQILALQFTIAWAGEGRSQPKRLGWWDTDLVDEAGGGDFFARLAPRTHAWAALEAVVVTASKWSCPPRRREAAAASIHDLLKLSQLPSELWEQLKNVDSSRVGRGPDVLIVLQYLQDMFDNNIRLLKGCG